MELKKPLVIKVCPMPCPSPCRKPQLIASAFLTTDPPKKNIFVIAMERLAVHKNYVSNRTNPLPREPLLATRAFG